MGDIKLLDCTLRDGGYVNDWNFGHNNLVSIFERLVDANVDFIEVGFLDDSITDPNSYGDKIRKYWDFLKEWLGIIPYVYGVSEAE